MFMYQKPRYFGLHIRIIKHNAGLIDETLVVQKENPLAGGWIDMRTFHMSDSLCYTNAYEYAQALSNNLSETI